MHKLSIAVTATTVAALAGCAPQKPAAPAATVDLNVGIAKTCTSSPVDLSSGSGGSATISMTNDGWCAVRTKDKDGQPFKFGLVKAKSQHGRILIQKIGGETRIEYTPENNYVGTDRFSVALASNLPGTPDSAIQVTVNVSLGEGMAPTAAAPEARPATSPSRSPATRASTPARHR